MNEISSQLATPLSIEDGVKVVWNNARQDVRARHRKCRAGIRKAPMTSMLGAVAVGCLLHRLPVRSILVTHIRILSALTPPAAVLFGAAKLYEFLQRQQPAKRQMPGE